MTHWVEEAGVWCVAAMIAAPIVLAVGVWATMTVGAAPEPEWARLWWWGGAAAALGGGGFAGACLLPRA